MTRNAYICNHKDHNGQVERLFLEKYPSSAPKCSLGHTMLRQANRPYMKAKPTKEKAT